jgi:hypothetical protein
MTHPETSFALLPSLPRLACPAHALPSAIEIVMIILLFESCPPLPLPIYPFPPLLLAVVRRTPSWCLAPSDILTNSFLRLPPLRDSPRLRHVM